MVGMICWMISGGGIGGGDLTFGSGESEWDTGGGVQEVGSGHFACGAAAALEAHTAGSYAQQNAVHGHIR